MIELVYYQTWKKTQFGYESARRIGLVKRGVKWMKVVAIDANANGGLKVWRVRMSEEAYMKPVFHKGKPYPMKRALTIFRRMTKSHGATKGAKKIIKEARNQ